MMEIEHSPRTSFQSLLFQSFVKYTDHTIAENETRYHGKKNLMTLALIDHEISQVIDPSLTSPMIEESKKAVLDAKKKELEIIKKNLQRLFSEGKLNATTYPAAILKMKGLNAALLNEIPLSMEIDIARVKKRLEVLEQEIQEYKDRSMQIEPENKMSASRYFSRLEKLSPETLAKVLETRIAQYWGLANFLNDRVGEILDPEEKLQMKERLKTFFFPLVTKGKQYLEEFKAGNRTAENTTFLRREMVELNPTMLYGKSVEEREQDLQKLIEDVEECIKEESVYINVLKTALEDTDQVGGPIRNKIKEAEKAVQKYHEYVEKLSKLSSQNYMWVPTPKVVFRTEQRIVNLSNPEIPGNSMQVIFKRLNNIERGFYWIRWGVETHEGYVQFDSSYCDSKTLAFDYKEMVELTGKTKMDTNFEKKEINVEVLYKKFMILSEQKVAHGSISLAEFARSNIIEGKIKLEGDSDSELSYCFKIRQPLMKSTRIEVKTIHAFLEVPAFNKEAFTPQTSSTPQKTQPKLVQQPTNKISVAPVQEKIHQNPVPVINQGTHINNVQKPSPPVQQQQQPKEVLPSLIPTKTFPPLVLLKKPNDPLASIQEAEIPSGLTLDQILNPGDPEKIESFSVLQAMVPVLESTRIVLVQEGRRNDNKLVGENWTKAQKKSMILEAKFAQGDIEPEAYLEQLLQALERDRKLLKFYQERMDADRFAFIREKISLVEKEAQELKEGLGAAD